MMTKVKVLWNGGWDIYEVDLDDMVEDTTPPLPNLLAYNPILVVDGHRYVRLSFVWDWRRTRGEKAARMIRHVKWTASLKDN